VRERAVEGEMKKIVLFLAVLTMVSPASARDDFAKAILDAHNRERAAVHVPSLVWDSDLAADAAVWAKHLADSGRFEHSSFEARKGEGENLWEGTRGGFAPGEMVGAWIAEKTYFDGGAFRTGVTRGHVTGHYTQMIWRNTNAVGCAMAGARDIDVLVCRYSPAGNVVGETPY
jgi:uncharacterized protein YkwD